MALVEHLASFFADFGETVTVDGAAVTAIVDDAFNPALGVAGTAPRLTCITSDVAAVAAGAAATVRATAYTVRGHERDGAGVSTLVLERA